MKFLSFYLCSAIISLASSSPSSLVVRNLPGASSHDTITAVARSLHLMSRASETVFKNSTSFARTLKNATLLSLSREVNLTKETKANAGVIEAGVEIVCNHCYFKTDVSVTLTIDSTIPLNQTFSAFKTAVKNEIRNVSDAIGDWIDDTGSATWDTMTAVLDFNETTSAADVEFPILDIDFNIDLPAGILPKTNLQIGFDDFEVYIDMGLKLSAGVTYTIPLLPPQAHALGIGKSSDLFIGAILALELILSSKGDVDLSAGIHIALDNNVSMELELFGRNLTNSNFPGGSIEFLPVTVTSADVTFSAILQVAVHAGFNMDIPSALSSFGVSAGIEAYAFSNLAEFTMSITGEEETREENGCMLNIANDFKFGVGVGAGATAALTGQTWGPTAHSTVDIWTTTFWDVCGNRVPATISPVPTKTVQRRQVASTRKMSTATKKTTAAYTGVVCKEPLKECPASLQKHTVVSSIMTLTSVLPSGATPAWPTTAYESVVKTMDFGEGRRKLFVAAGEPTAKMANNFVDDTKDKLKGKGVDKKMIIGVSVGVGGFVILVAIGGIIFCIRRRRLQTQPPAGTGYLGLGAGSGNENSSTPGVSTESINVPRKGI